MLGALLAPCGAGAAAKVQQSKMGSPAPRKIWTERAARAIRSAAGEASGERLVALAPIAQNPSSLSKVWLLGHKMMQKGCR